MSQRLVEAADLSDMHDAELFRVSMDRDHWSLELEFKGEDQTVYKILFSGILAYKINNIQYQNVVSRILTSRFTPDLEGDLEKVVRWTSSGSANDLLISEENLRKNIGRIRSGELQLYYVEPSWGAEIGVIAQTASLTRDRR